MRTWLDDIDCNTMFRSIALVCIASLALLQSTTASSEILPSANRSALDESLIGPPRENAVEGDLPASPVSARGLENLRAFARVYGLVRWFHPSDAAKHADWTNVALAGIPKVEAARSSTELARALGEIFLPLAPTLQIVAAKEHLKSFDSASPQNRLRWRHRGIGTDPVGIYSSSIEAFMGDGASAEHTEHLPGGISIRLPLTVIAAEDGTAASRTTIPEFATGKPEGWVPAGFDRTTRLASTMIAWNLFQHFYPYWDQVPVDWNSSLGPALERAALASDDRAFAEELAHFLALLRDGHAWVRYRPWFAAELPFNWKWVEGQLVVTDVDWGAQSIPPGSTVQAINGMPIEDALAKQITLISGSPQWQRHVALNRMRYSDKETEIANLTVRSMDGKLTTATVPFEATQEHRFAASRRAVVEEIEPGILYVDLTRLDEERFAAEAERIENAAALIFDLRGYPAGKPSYLAHMSDRLMLSAKMELPEYVAPDGFADRWDDGSWKVRPALPRYTENIVFLMDESAVSFAESILGTVKGNRLATLIGEPTAGANGNLTRFILPGGYMVSWTAMRVTNQDGSPHHVVGVFPDILVTRTVAGVREGRDEQFDAAARYVSRQMVK